MRRLLSVLTLGFVFFATIVVAKEQTPIETVRVEPLEFNALTGLAIEPILTDNSEMYIFQYRWFLNGEENLFETADSFPGELLKRGDKLSVEVTPISSQGVKLEPFTSLPLEAVNAPPVITSTPPARLGTHKLSYQVKATDPDADSVTYRLEKCPQGMTIDNTKGNINWVFAKQPEGVFPVLVIVEDDFGGRAEQNFELNLSFVKKRKAE